MFTALFIILLFMCVLPYLEHLPSAGKSFYRASFYSKLVVLLSPLSILLLFFPDALSRNLLPLAYAYSLTFLGYQGYRLYRIKRERGSWMSRPCLWLYFCVALILFTPLCDIFLARTYSHITTVVVGSSTLALLGLHLAEVFLSHPVLSKNTKY